MTTYYARVIETIAEQRLVVLLVDGKMQTVKGVLAPDIQRGAWVQVVAELADGPCSFICLNQPADGAWADPGEAMRWSLPDSQGVTRLDRLRLRGEIVRSIRDYFHGESFIEMQTPLLVNGTCPDASIQSFRVADKYLTTSTEYQLKRMFAGGFQRLFTLTQNFRNEIADRTHNPEFTMLEWARVGAGLAQIEEDVQRFVRLICTRFVQSDVWKSSDAIVAYINGPWDRMSVRDALAVHLGVLVPHDFNSDEFVDAARSVLEIPEGFEEDPSLLISYLIDLIQPKLGQGRPIFLCDWPAFLTSSAATSVQTPSVAERSELFMKGEEIADGFPFLISSSRQLSYFERANNTRTANGIEPVVLDGSYLQAVRLGLPPGAGMAMGVDRLVMVLIDAADIRDVMPFAWDEL